MKTKLLFTFLFLGIFTSIAQVTETQTWEVFRPGVKLIYDINACENNDPEPSTDDFFYCDGPDRVIVKSFGLTHPNVLSTHQYSHNNEDFVAFATQKGLSVFNKTNKTWKNVPIEVLNTDFSSNFFDVKDVDGKLLFSGSDVRTKIYNPADNSITGISNDVLRELKKSSDGSIWGYVNGGKKLIRYNNGITTTVNITGTSSNNYIYGFDIASDDKIYLAVYNYGVVIYDPSNGTQTSIKSDNSDLFSNEVQDVDFDESGNLWIAIGSTVEVENGQLVKWNISSNTFTNYERPAGNNNGGIDFKKVEAVGDTVWLSSLSDDKSDRGLFKVTFEGETAEWEHFDGEFFTENYIPRLSNYDGTYFANNLTSYGNTLYVSIVNHGVIEIANGKWNYYNPLQNNLPSGGDYATQGKLLQNKQGGVVYVANGNTDVISYINNDSFSNFVVKGNEISNITQGKLDDEGNFYSFYKDLSNNRTKFHSLDYPFLFEQVTKEDLNNYSVNTNSKYAVEGFNKWYYQRLGNDAVLFNLDTRIGYKKSQTNLDFGNSRATYLTEGRDERVWALSDKIRYYDVLTDTSGELALNNFSGIWHNVHGQAKKIVFGANNNEIWIVLSRGLVYVKDGQEKYTLSEGNSILLSAINDFVVDADNNAYVVSSGGFLKITNVNNTTPTLTEYHYTNQDDEAGPRIHNLGWITIDNKGNKWFRNTGDNGTTRLIKFNEGNDATGITNGATSGSLRGKISGRIFIDNNENDVYDENTDGVAKNQAIHVKYNDTELTVYTNNQGLYNVPIYTANTEYELAISSTNGFAYTEKRNFKLNVSNLDGDYSNNNIPLKIDDIKSLYIKGSTKEGAWGFSGRPGFENQFVSAIANLSKTKTFNDVKLRYTFENTNSNRANYAINQIEELKIYKVKQNNNNLLIDDLIIYPDRLQQWKIDLDPVEYTLTEIANPIFTEENQDKLKTVEITIGDIAPFENIVIQIKTTTFDPVSRGDYIKFGPKQISASNWDDAKSNNFAKNDNWRDTTPDSDDSKSGRHEDLSPYTDPEDVYKDEEDVYRDRKDIYSDAPYETEIFSSYDPNDKLVTPGVANGENKTDIAKKWLTYTIRFQNNGNFSAKDVYVIDTLDVDLNKNSFQFIESSHDIKISEIGTKDYSIKKFLFQDIYLIDSLTDPEGSQGYLKFKIKAKEDIAENTLVENTAHIYFDQNPAIVTNTVKNIFRTPPIASVKIVGIREEFYMHPNPAKNNVQISANNYDIQRVEIYSSIGKRVISKTMKSQTATINTTNLSTGIYIIKAQINNQVISKKLIINK